MSLISTASPWTNDDTANKKRASSMRKTIKTKPATMNHNYEMYSETDNDDDKQDYMIHNLDNVQKASDDRMNRVNEMIHKMTLVSGDNGGDKLADFNPPPKPEVQLKKDLQEQGKPADPPISNLANPLQMPSPTFSNKSVNPYIVNNASNISLGNYQQVYTPQVTPLNKPYYASMGIGSGSSSDGKLLEKINYMIHLLENQENEKTANITEEFVLYTFMGVFIIFVIDSFSRNGKYVR
jgi:hypothetical protein